MGEGPPRTPLRYIRPDLGREFLPPGAPLLPAIERVPTHAPEAALYVERILAPPSRGRARRRNARRLTDRHHASSHGVFTISGVSASRARSSSEVCSLSDPMSCSARRESRIRGTRNDRASTTTPSSIPKGTIKLSVWRRTGGRVLSARGNLRAIGGFVLPLRVFGLPPPLLGAAPAEGWAV